MCVCVCVCVCVCERGPFRNKEIFTKTTTNAGASVVMLINRPNESVVLSSTRGCGWLHFPKR